MADGSLIEWTDATWNPVTGCKVVSPGCANCYAMRLAGTRLRDHPSRRALTIGTKAGPVWNGKVRRNGVWMALPIRWKRSRRVFVCAHGDLFYEEVRDYWIDEIFAVMALSPQHEFQVLTKRSARMRAYMNDPEVGRRVWREAARIVSQDLRLAPTHPGAAYITAGEAAAPWPLPNVWLGVSAEDQVRADERIPDLIASPAAVRFLSAEPLLGSIDLTRVRRFPEFSREFIDALRGTCWTDQGPVKPDPSWSWPGRKMGDGPRLDWVIVGGENGPRPTHPAWVRDLRDQCAHTGVAFFFKQWGSHRVVRYDDRNRPDVEPDLVLAFNGEIDRNGPPFAPPDTGGPRPRWVTMAHVGKSAAGRILDGQTWSQFPAAARTIHQPTGGENEDA